MNSKIFVMAGLAVTFGAVSYFAGNSWLDSQAQARISKIESEQPAVKMETVVVTTAQVRFGQKLTPENLKEVPWPAEALPEGAFKTIAALTEKGERTAIKTIEPGEPVLAVKVTGENGRAGLAGIITEGMRAVTIPVDLVNGVGGFVMPGDRVDIVLTKKDADDGEQAAKIIMENIKVLSIDQDADRADEGARVAKSVTLETDAPGAQKLALANSVGRLSLLLRSAGDEDKSGTSTLSANSFDDASGTPAKADAASDENFFGFLNSNKKRFATVSVVKREEVVQHSVPATEAEGEANKSGQ
jgi:pilus assembly protein CpaB